MNVYLANAELRPELEKIPTIPESSNGYMYQESKNVDMVKDTVVQESNWCTANYILQNVFYI